MPSAYRIMAAHNGADPLLHLIHDHAEASLCGLPRVALGSTIQARDVVCQTCLDWLPKRAQASAIRRRNEAI